MLTRVRGAEEGGRTVTWNQATRGRILRGLTQARGLDPLFVVTAKFCENAVVLPSRRKTSRTIKSHNLSDTGLHDMCHSLLERSFKYLSIELLYSCMRY